MISTSKNVLFPGHDHLLTTSADDPSLLLSPEHKKTFLEVANMVFTWWIVAFLCSGPTCKLYLYLMENVAAKQNMEAVTSGYTSCNYCIFDTYMFHPELK